MEDTSVKKGYYAYMLRVDISLNDIDNTIDEYLSKYQTPYWLIGKEITKTKKPPTNVIIFISEDKLSITTLSLNKVSLLTEKVSLIVIIAVIKIANKDKINVILELSFLNTPKTSKNIIESEIKISGNTKFKFSILFTSYICTMHIN